MSFSTTNPWVQYAGNDSTTEFSLPDKIYAEGDVVVLLTVDATLVTTTQTITTHYTVADVAEDAHDNTTPIITMLTPPATGETLTLYRQVDLIQGLSFETGEFWQSLSAEKQFDLLMMSIQWLYLLVERCAIGSLASDPVDTTLEEILTALGILPLSSLPEKTTVVDADILLLGDSEDSGSNKNATLANLWNYINAKVVALYALITSQAGAPSSTPAKVGNLNIDLTNDIPYIATDTASSADWKRLVQFIELLNTSAGAGDAGKPIKLDSLGQIALNMLKSASTTAKGIQENATAAEIDSDAASLTVTAAQLILSKYGDNLQDNATAAQINTDDADLTVTPAQLILSKYAGTLQDNAIITLIGAGGEALAAGLTQARWVAPCAGTFTKATVLLDQSGSIVIDIWKDTYANYPPDNSDSITNSNELTVVTAIKGQDTDLTGTGSNWVINFVKDDIFFFYIDSADTALSGTIDLQYDKTGA